jgi:DNA-3-methyladenine glycosylase II
MQLFQYGPAEIDYLTRRDRKLGRAIGRIGMIERPVTPDLFTALVHSIVAQQIFRKAADTVWSKLCERLLDVTPHTVVGADVSNIQKCGMSMRKAGYIKGVGEAAIRGDVDLLELRQMSDEGLSKNCRPWMASASGRPKCC